MDRPDPAPPRPRRPALAQLIDLLRVEEIEETIFRGQSQDLGWGAIFGGQVLGQALWAASRTVEPHRTVHSMHAYFLRRGDAARPVVYEVDRIRDGKSFSTRRVVAIQAGRPIFNMSASFQIDEGGFEHHDPMPQVPGPEGLATETQLAARIADRIPAPLRPRALGDKPIEIRPVEVRDPTRPIAAPPVRHVWFRAADPLPPDPALHQALWAYASDFHFMTTVMQPHGVSWLTPGLHVASLDHAMWWHQAVTMDRWLLYVVDSPAASHARGLARGRVFTQEGRLVASTTQEGLIRLGKPRPGDVRS